jgi:hypothetical protein
MTIAKQRLLVFLSVIALVAGAFAILYVTTLNDAFERNSRDSTGITEKNGYFKYRDELRLKIEIDGQQFDVAGSSICFYQQGYNSGLVYRPMGWFPVGDRTIYWRAQEGTRYALRSAEFCNEEHLNRMPKSEPGQTFSSTVPDPATFDVIRIQPDGASAEMFFGAQRQGLGSSRVALRSIERTTTRLSYPQDGTESQFGPPLPPSECWRGLVFEITTFPPRGHRPELDLEIDRATEPLAVFSSHELIEYIGIAGASASIFAPAENETAGYPRFDSEIDMRTTHVDLTLPKADSVSGPAPLFRQPNLGCQSGIGQIAYDAGPTRVSDGAGHSINIPRTRTISSKHQQAFFVLGTVSARIPIQN